jgi:hypothetical protein
MNPVFLVILCVALVWVLFLMLRRGAQQEAGRAGGIAQGSEYVVRLPRRSLLHECLAVEDLEFIRARKSPPLLRLFLRERRRLAEAWLRETRREAHRLVRLHVNSVRYAADLRPAAEVRLFFAVVLFLLVYVTMLSLVWWFGRWRTRRLLDSIQALAGILARLVDRIVAAVVPGALPGLGAAAGVMR